MTNLNFEITLGMLYGMAGGKRISMHAVSGGGGGKHRSHGLPAGIPNYDLVNNSRRVSVEASSRILEVGLDPRGEGRGGPIPPGPYRIYANFKHRPNPNNPHDYQLRAKLEPDRGRTSVVREPDWGRACGCGHRSGFEIHFIGYFGSDGCIVVLNTDDFIMLMRALWRDHKFHGDLGRLNVSA